MIRFPKFIPPSIAMRDWELHGDLLVAKTTARNMLEGESLGIGSKFPTMQDFLGSLAELYPEALRINPSDLANFENLNLCPIGSKLLSDEWLTDPELRPHIPEHAVKLLSHDIRWMAEKERTAVTERATQAITDQLARAIIPQVLEKEYPDTAKLFEDFAPLVDHDTAAKFYDLVCEHKDKFKD